MSFHVMYFMAFISLAYVVLSASLLLKVVGGDITKQEAWRVWWPLAGFYVLAHLALGSYPMLTYLPGVAGLGYGIWLMVQQRAAVQGALNEMLDHDIRKWKDAVVADDRNAYGHLQLGHAYVEARDYNSAVLHYRKALLLDRNYARELDMFLSRRKPAEDRKVRSRLPDLEGIMRQLRDRGTPTGKGPWVR